MIRKFIVVLLIVIPIYFMVKDTSLTSLNLGNDVDLVFPMGRYTVTIPRMSVNLDSGSHSGRVRKYGIDDECSQVSGVYSVTVERTDPEPQSPYQARPFISIESWAENTVLFRTEAEKEKMRKAMRNLKDLEVYTDSMELQKKVLAPGYVSSTDDPLLPTAQPNLNIWNGYTACTMIYSVPIYIERIHNENYDTLYYSELLEGNGDTYGSPVRALILEKENNWMLIKEGPITYEPILGCPESSLSSETASCIYHTWAEGFRDQSENQKWISNTLKAISFE